MGWNTGFTIMEQTVIGAYDLGKLDTALLTVIMEPYASTDIDSGGRVGLETKDCKCVEEVVIAIMRPAAFTELMALKTDYEASTTPEDFNDKLRAYSERRAELFSAITEQDFGWS